MTIDRPTREQIPQLENLWLQAFGDPKAFIDGFFSTGFSPDRCRCLTVDGQVAAALYWFDAQTQDGKFAYLYAVATELSHRGKGLFPRLLEDTHQHLTENGYAGAVLVPAEEGLWDYYKKLGYTAFGGLRSFTAGSAPGNIALQEIDANTYTRLRSSYLPAHSLCQEQALGFYSTWGKFYQGDGCLFAAATDEELLYVQEFLGDTDKIPVILATLGCSRGKFRTPGGDERCGMYLLFTPEASAPAYLGFPLD